MSKERIAPYLDAPILEALVKRSPQTLEELRVAVQGSRMIGAEDRARHPKRDNEPKWYSDLSNRLQPTRSGSLAARGYVSRVGRGTFAITDDGVLFLEKEQALSRFVSDIVKDIELD